MPFLWIERSSGPNSLVWLQSEAAHVVIKDVSFLKNFSFVFLYKVIPYLDAIVVKVNVAVRIGEKTSLESTDKLGVLNFRFMDYLLIFIVHDLKDVFSLEVCTSVITFSREKNHLVRLRVKIHCLQFFCLSWLLIDNIYLKLMIMWNLQPRCLVSFHRYHA